jgi:hypothetical protein
MPQAINLVIKNAAAIDKTFALNTPAAGDSGVAEWALKEGLISSVFPKLTASARRTGNNSRKVSIKLRVPSSYVNTTTNLPVVGSAFEANVEATVPDDYPEAMKDDAVAFTANAIATALFKSMIRDGLPAT